MHDYPIDKGYGEVSNGLLGKDLGSLNIFKRQKKKA